MSLAITPAAALEGAWLRPWPKLELAAGELHVWRAALEADDAGFARVERLLSSEERRRAWRFRAEGDRRGWILAHGILRCVLGRYLGAAPASLRLAAAPLGKPFLNIPAGGWLRFNLSHSGGMAIVGLCRGREVGVDLEAVRALADEEAFARRILSERERSELSLLAEEERRRALFAGWTRKEAYLKATGEGLAVDLDRIEVCLAPGEARICSVRGDENVAASWSLFALSPAEGYAGAVVVKGKVARLRLWDWDWVL